MRPVAFKRPMAFNQNVETGLAGLDVPPRDCVGVGLLD